MNKLKYIQLKILTFVLFLLYYINNIEAQAESPEIASPNFISSFLPLIIMGLMIFGIYKLIKFIGKCIVNAGTGNDINNKKYKIKKINLNDFRQYLLKNNLGNYIELLEKNNLLDNDVINNIDENDLEKIGINIMGDRKKIINYIREK